MTERTTIKQVEGVFSAFCETMGKRVATSYDDVGAWRLAYVACYGGFNIEEISNKGGGIRQPFGSRRFPPAQMWEMLRFAMHAVEQSKQSEQVAVRP